MAESYLLGEGEGAVQALADHLRGRGGGGNNAIEAVSNASAAGGGRRGGAASREQYTTAPRIPDTNRGGNSREVVLTARRSSIAL